MRTIAVIVTLASVLGAWEFSGSVPEGRDRDGQIVGLSGLVSLMETEGERRDSVQRDTLANASSVFDGVYSPIQASSGEEMFQRACEACHENGEFAGPRFRFRWREASLGDIYQYISTAMPQGDPGSLKPVEYANIIAYFLSMNDYPSGDEPLPPDTSILSNLRFSRPAN